MIRAGTRARRGTMQGMRACTGLTPALAAALAGVLATLGVPNLTPQAAAAADTTHRSPTSQHHYSAGTDVAKVCNERACVHRATSGEDTATEQWAAATLDRLTTTWGVLVDEFGFPAPAPSPDADGDGRFHLYLADLGDRFYGMTVMGDPAPGHTRRVRSHLVVDNDMAGFGGSARDNLAATVAHEFFHAISVNMDLTADVWFAEASATWAETQVFPASRVNRSYLREGQIGRRSLPLDHADGGYGNFPLVERLAAVSGRDAVRRVWERLETLGNRDYALTAIEAVLAADGVAWDRFYSQYAMANTFPRQHYPARLREKVAASEFSVTLGRTSRTRSQARRLQHLTAHTSTIRLSSAVKKARVAVSVSSSKAKRTSATLVVVRRDGSLRKVPLRFNPRGTARTTVTYTRSKVARLVVVTANTSLKFRDCASGTGWSCDGVPVDDRTRVEIRTRTL